MGLPVRVEGKAHFFREVRVGAVAVKCSRAMSEREVLALLLLSRSFSAWARRCESMSKSTVELRRDSAGVV